jgi:alkylation response protein AidB-like acyl-CoA dehydrogenase
MDLHYTTEELAFRDTLRSFLQASLPLPLQRKVRHHLRLSKEDLVSWHRTVARQGWAAPNWPVEHGGTGWTAVQCHLWEEECARAGTPPILPFGVSMVAPVIMAFGSAAQKAHYLPRILNCDDWWCQGYSEPGAGSDLAALSTTAALCGDHYIVNGQKTWTTLAQHADMIFCLVRTDASVRKQAGISFLLIDMQTPGITLRPIIMLDEDHEINEVFFDDVKVPVENLIGEENKGWTYAKYLLGHERTGIAAVARSQQELLLLKELAKSERKNGKTLLEDPLFAAKVALLEIELMALETTLLRVISSQDHGPGPQASMLKIRGSEIQQTLTELMMEAIGPQALPFDPLRLGGAADVDAADDEGNAIAPLAARYFNYRKTSIYGGSNEIQKNIIAQMILGL